MTDVSRQGAGWLARCDCGWERYETRRPVLDAAVHKHTCHKVRAPKQAAPRKSSGSAWKQREEGSSWIDKL